MYALVMTVHVAVCVILILVVLLQAGRGAGLAVFGGGGSEALFTTPTSTGFLKKLTTTLAATFAVTSLFLTLLSGRSGMRSVTRTADLSIPAPQQTEPPQTSAPAGGRQASGSPASPSASSGQGVRKQAGGKGAKK